MQHFSAPAKFNKFSILSSLCVVLVDATLHYYTCLHIQIKKAHKVPFGIMQKKKRFTFQVARHIALHDQASSCKSLHLKNLKRQRITLNIT